MGKESTREDGATLVLVAMFLIGLLAFIALAVDGGRALAERRQVRNAADHAALNAAWASCNGEDPQTAADLSVVRNGYPTTSLSLTHLGGFTFRAQVNASLGTGFAGIVGIDQLDVAGIATAGCQGTSGSGYAIFAGGEDCFDNGKYQIDISGSKQIVYGNVHSNNNVVVGGSDNDFRGADNDQNTPPEPNDIYEFTFVPDDPTDFPNNLTIEDFKELDFSVSKGTEYDIGYPTFASVQAWPVGAPFDLSEGDYSQFWKDRAVFSTVNADITADDMKDGSGNYIDGVYYTENGDIFLNDSDIGTEANPVHITLVSRNGKVEINGSKQYLEPFTDHPDLMFNTYLVYGGIKYDLGTPEQCDKEAIKVNGSDSQWNGVFYAPNALISFSGSGTSTILNGSLIGWAVRLGGSEITIKAPDDTTPGPAQLQLLQ